MKKFLLILFTIHCVLFTANAQVRWNERYQQYIDQYKDIAIEEMHRWKIPASITLAQGLFESGAGQSDLARKGKIILALSATAGRGAPSITTMTHATSVSVPTTLPTSRSKTIRVFWSMVSATAVCSVSRPPIIRDGREA